MSVGPQPSRPPVRGGSSCLCGRPPGRACPGQPPLAVGWLDAAFPPPRHVLPRGSPQPIGRPVAPPQGTEVRVPFPWRKACPEKLLERAPHKTVLGTCRTRPVTTPNGKSFLCGRRRGSPKSQRSASPQLCGWSRRVRPWPSAHGGVRRGLGLAVPEGLPSTWAGPGDGGSRGFVGLSRCFQGRPGPAPSSGLRAPAASQGRRLPGKLGDPVTRGHERPPQASPVNFPPRNDSLVVESGPQLPSPGDGAVWAGSSFQEPDDKSHGSSPLETSHRLWKTDSLQTSVCA